MSVKLHFSARYGIHPYSNLTLVFHDIKRLQQQLTSSAIGKMRICGSANVRILKRVKCRCFFADFFADVMGKMWMH